MKDKTQIQTKVLRTNNRKMIRKFPKELPSDMIMLKKTVLSTRRDIQKNRIQNIEKDEMLMFRFMGFTIITKNANEKTVKILAMALIFIFVLLTSIFFIKRYV